MWMFQKKTQQKKNRDGKTKLWKKKTMAVGREALCGVRSIVYFVQSNQKSKKESEKDVLEHEQIRRTRKRTN
jgi:hypothetical protein